MKATIFASLCAAAVLVPQAAFSQEAPAAATPAATVEAQAAPEKVFGAGDLDILANFGFNIVYVHVEPAIDVGVIPIADDFTISLGGGFGYGYCVLCGALTAVSRVNVSSSYMFPYGRANLHVNTLGGLIPSDIDGMTLDLYAGIYGGPQFYRFALDFEDDADDTRATVTQTSVRLGPALGVRLGFKDNRLLLFGEYRWGAELGFTTVRIENEDGTVYDITGDDYARRGSDFVLGLGLRI